MKASRRTRVLVCRSPRWLQRSRSARAATMTTRTAATSREGARRSASCCPRRRRRGTRRSDKPLFEAKVEELCPDCTIEYQNADQDPAKQQQQVEAAVTEGVDVMVLDPVDSTAAGWTRDSAPRSRHSGHLAMTG